jgi:hypothetical protein
VNPLQIEFCNNAQSVPLPYCLGCVLFILIRLLLSTRCFGKKTQKTAKADLDIAARRLRALKQERGA